MPASDNSHVASYIANHPRMAGVLFTLLLLLSQAGSVGAVAGATISGP